MDNAWELYLELLDYQEATVRIINMLKKAGEPAIFVAKFERMLDVIRVALANEVGCSRKF